MNETGLRGDLSCSGRRGQKAMILNINIYFLRGGGDEGREDELFSHLDDSSIFKRDLIESNF